MKKDFFKSKSALYGIIISVVSIVALVVIFAVKDGIYEEYEKIKTEEGCFQGENPDPGWKKLTAEEKKAKTRKCMTTLNKVTQVNYGPYIFSFTLVIGIFLFILSLINTGRNADRIMEEMDENDS